MLLENLPEDLLRDIRRHLFNFIKKVRIFALLDEPIIDAICERLRQKTYIAGSKVLYRGGLVDKMVFIIRGKMESIGEDGNVASLSEGDACGEELLAWCLEHSSINGGDYRSFKDCHVSASLAYMHDIMLSLFVISDKINSSASLELRHFLLSK
ncbi:probable cyclic nucleotide-gated ion channel 20, chloroplastic [Nicotiana tomentosiformis]|uniref:probable cyclic nucleotide-gated ion channel 20, chloroplastic n=1 Tax=Nicotiana tomentosiformis TaxID=4098 RepID=UPI00051B763C